MEDVYPNTEWLTTKQVCQFLQVTRQTLYNWARQGRLKAFKATSSLHGHLRFRKSDVHAFLAKRDEQQAQKLQSQLTTWLKEVAQLTDEEWENDSAADFGGTKTFYSNVADGAVEHDYYIYGSPKRSGSREEKI